MFTAALVCTLVWMSAGDAAYIRTNPSTPQPARPLRYLESAFKNTILHTRQKRSDSVSNMRTTTEGATSSITTAATPPAAHKAKLTATASFGSEEKENCPTKSLTPKKYDGLHAATLPPLQPVCVMNGGCPCGHVRINGVCVVEHTPATPDGRMFTINE